MGKQSKRQKASNEVVENLKHYDIAEAVSLVKNKIPAAKFDEVVEIAMNLGVDPKHADQQVRGILVLPNGTGKSVRVAVFAKGAKAKEAKTAGADVIGDDELADQVKAGQVDFDRCIATPDMMPLVGQLGKVLGPKGLMPNPKLGTVTNDIEQAVKAAKGGQVEFRTEKTGIVQAGVGKRSFEETALVENIKAFVGAINRAKPSGAKGTYIKSVYISTTMGPSLRISIPSVLAA